MIDNLAITVFLKGCICDSEIKEIKEKLKHQFKTNRVLIFKNQKEDKLAITNFITLETIVI